MDWKGRTIFRMAPIYGQPHKKIKFNKKILLGKATVSTNQPSSPHNTVTQYIQIKCKKSVGNKADEWDLILMRIFMSQLR